VHTVAVTESMREFTARVKGNTAHSCTIQSCVSPSVTLCGHLSQRCGCGGRGCTLPMELFTNCTEDLTNTLSTVGERDRSVRQHLGAVQTRERQSGNACMHAQPVTRKWCDRGVCCGRERYLPLRGGKKRASRRSLAVAHEGVVVSIP
jgi:hypothetical protein